MGEIVIPNEAKEVLSSYYYVDEKGNLCREKVDDLSDFKKLVKGGKK